MLKAKDGLISARALAKVFLDCTFSGYCSYNHAFPETNRSILECASLEKQCSVTICLSAGKNCPASLVGLFIMEDRILFVALS